MTRPMPRCSAQGGLGLRRQMLRQPPHLPSLLRSRVPDQVAPHTSACWQQGGTPLGLEESPRDPRSRPHLRRYLDRCYFGTCKKLLIPTSRDLADPTESLSYLLAPNQNTTTFLTTTTTKQNTTKTHKQTKSL